MSEAGWRAFLADAGAEEWAVLHGGPTAVFRTSSLADAAALAQAIAAVPGLDGTNAQINLLVDRVTVRLTREVWKIEESHAALAQAISAVARAHGAAVDRVGLGGDGDLHLVNRGTIGRSAMRPCRRRDRSGERSMRLLDLPDLAGEANRHAIGEQVDLRVGAVKAGHGGNRLRQCSSIGK